LKDGRRRRHRVLAHERVRIVRETITEAAIRLRKRKMGSNSNALTSCTSPTAPVHPASNNVDSGIDTGDGSSAEDAAH
jgi:hypothetical protein